MDPAGPKTDDDPPQPRAPTRPRFQAASLRVHHLLDASRANGPGTRAVIWVQGCSLRCPSCFNPETHDPRGGRSVALPALLDWYAQVAPAVDGLTVTGGEPLEQAASLRSLLEAAERLADLPVLLFTGWTWPAIKASEEASACLRLTDAVVAGPYIRTAARPAGRSGARPQEPATASGPWGSANQELRLLGDRFAPADFAALPAAEVWVGADGRIVVTGTDPPAILPSPGPARTP